SWSCEMTTLTKELIDIYEPVTRACCRSHRLSKDLVDDVMHDTFLVAYRNLSKCREQTRLSSWLWIIAQSQIVNRMRKESLRKQQEIADPLLQSSQNPSAVAQWRELRQKVRAGVATLPDTWMTVVKLFYWHQKNTREIAVHMQIAPGAVRVILHRSRQRLRRELEGIYAA
ncbi:MAG: RNA polymerase sigma factor, partial [Planctomycetota bacterium]